MRVTDAVFFAVLALILWRVTVLDSVVVMSSRRIHNYLGVRVSEVQDAVDAVVAQIGKAQAEILAQIAALEAREPSVDLTALKAAAQSLDDLNPDPVVVEPPVDVAPVEPPVE